MGKSRKSKASRAENKNCLVTKKWNGHGCPSHYSSKNHSISYTIVLAGADLACYIRGGSFNLPFNCLKRVLFVLCVCVYVHVHVRTCEYVLHGRMVYVASSLHLHTYVPYMQVHTYIHTYSPDLAVGGYSVATYVSLSSNKVHT